MSDGKKQQVNFYGKVEAENQVFGDQTVYGNLVFNKVAAASDEQNAELARLVEKLAEALKRVPAKKKEDAEAVEVLAQEALDEASRAEPRRKILEIRGDGLKKAAKNLLAISPIVGKIVRNLLGN